MTLNLLASVLTIVFAFIGLISAMIFVTSFSKPLINDNYTISRISAAVLFTSFVMVVIFGISAKNTNVRVKSETIPIVKTTGSRYAIRKDGGLEYHKLPATYQTTAGMSHIKETKAADWYVISKNQDQIGKSKVYINNK